jgi:hypothetical protein
MANSSTLYTGAGKITFWNVSLDTEDTSITIDGDNNTGVVDHVCCLVFAMSYNNIAHTLTFESWNGTIATALPMLEFDGSIGMLERIGSAFIPSKFGQALRVKSTVVPVQYLFGISYDREFLRK